MAQEDGENFDTPLRNGGKAQVYRFGEITGNQSSFQFLSVDYGIAYSGLPVITERVLHSNMHALDWIPKAKNRVSQAFENARSF